LIRPLFFVWNRLKPFEQFGVCTETVFWTLNRLVTVKCIIWRKTAYDFYSLWSHSKNSKWTSATSCCSCRAM